MSRIDHIGIYVSDLERSKDFFERYFDARAGQLYHNVKKGFKSYFLTFGNGTRLELMTLDGIEPHNVLGRCHISIGVGSRQKVDELTRRLEADGFEIVGAPRTTGDGYYESVVADADNNLLEITE